MELHVQLLKVSPSSHVYHTPGLAHSSYNSGRNLKPSWSEVPPGLTCSCCKVMTLQSHRETHPEILITDFCPTHSSAQNQLKVVARSLMKMSIPQGVVQ